MFGDLRNALPAEAGPKVDGYATASAVFVMPALSWRRGSTKALISAMRLPAQAEVNFSATPAFTDAARRN